SRFNVSPKLANSGMPIEKRINETALKSLAAHRGTTFKFVISSPANWQEILTDFIEPGLIRREQVVLMPAGENQEQLAITRPVVADICKLHTIRFTDRLHVSVWDKKVGV
ncbi:MAG: hypothetical protein KDD04_02020, partial [Sinomicrobium sp.]|nr:hypothetical protein [Sinomicrobium sp.]